MMARFTCIYTRGGDRGKTSLSTGKRVSKHDLRVHSYGTVDETNAIIGIVRLYTQTLTLADIDVMLMRIQNDLFDLGADLCTPLDSNSSNTTSLILRVTESQVERLEHEIDAVTEQLPPLQSFILPGGTMAAAHIHQARTVCRRAERFVTELAEVEPEGINPIVVKYLNRLSDHLFVLARYTNGRGQADVLWVPGGSHNTIRRQ